MRECRFCPWCSYIEDHGCTKDSCRHYQPMPDVGALLKLADELEQETGSVCGVCMGKTARRIREACGEWRGDPRQDAIGHAAAHEDDELWCEHCDIELDESWLYCPNCGARVEP